MIESFFSDKQFSRDNLTGLYNREVIVEYVNTLIGRNIPFSLSLLDIDNFKYVNDTYGHALGDKVIQAVSSTIKTSIGEKGVVGRFGGDEFIIVYPELIEYDAVWRTCSKLSADIYAISIPEHTDLAITSTIGLARFPENERSYEKLLETADKALYRGKMKGRSCFIIYLPEKHANIVLKTEKDKSLSSLYLHSFVFRTLTNDSLKEGIKNLFNFLTSYYMLDHICIQADGKLLFEKIHELSRNKVFIPINEKLLDESFGFSTDIFHTNKIDDLKKLNKLELKKSFDDQKIMATCIVKIECKNKIYGILRAESTSQRIWQRGDMDIILTTAKTIGLILYERKTDLAEVLSGGDD